MILKPVTIKNDNLYNAVQERDYHAQALEFLFTLKWYSASPATDQLCTCDVAIKNDLGIASPDVSRERPKIAHPIVIA
jgi:hypothetical protein